MTATFTHAFAILQYLPRVGRLCNTHVGPGSATYLPLCRGGRRVGDLLERFLNKLYPVTKAYIICLGSYSGRHIFHVSASSLLPVAGS